WDDPRTDPGREGLDAPRLARAVRTTTEGAALGAAPHRERHRQVNWLRDVILGGQDGLVNILGIILGIIAGGGSNTVLVAAGFAAAITESISMGAVGYTSSISERDRTPGDSRHLRVQGLHRKPAGRRRRDD